MGNFELLNEQLEIRQQFDDALQKINEDKSRRKKSDLWETIQSVDKGRIFFEEFDLESWQNKVKVDMLYYEQFIQKLDTDKVQSIEQIIGSLYKDIYDIYEFVNLKAEVYGKNVTYDTLNETTEKCKQILSNNIFEYLDKNFYSLDADIRYSKYYDECRDLVKQVVAEGVEMDEAISHGVKTVLIEGLLGKIAFPFGVWSRIKYLSESEDYGRLFDQEKLVQLLDSYQQKLHKISRIIASVV